MGKQLDIIEVDESLRQLELRATEIGRAWSGSWLGHHSIIYHSSLAEPPAGARFSSEWGLMDRMFNFDTVGDWQEYRFSDIIDRIYQDIDPVNMEKIKARSSITGSKFEGEKTQVLSILSHLINTYKEDGYLRDTMEELEEIIILDAAQIIEAIRPTGKLISRDATAVHAGLRTPPHLTVLAEIQELRSPFIACEKLASLNRKISSHLEIITEHTIPPTSSGTKVFIGHGQSLLWKELTPIIHKKGSFLTQVIVLYYG